MKEKSFFKRSTTFLSESTLVGVSSDFTANLTQYIRQLGGVNVPDRLGLGYSDVHKWKDRKGKPLTTRLKGIVKSFFPTLQKKEWELMWSRIGVYMRNCYYPETEVAAFWGDARKLGSGEWEGSPTCFNRDGCNRHAPKWIHQNPRTQALVLEALSNNSTARCVCLFAGKHMVYMSNHYYSDGFPTSASLFARALSELTGTKFKLLGRSDSFPFQEGMFPIYLNGGMRLAIPVGDRGECLDMDRPPEYKHRCPECGIFHRWQATHFLGSEDLGEENTILASCSHGCAEKFADRNELLGGWEYTCDNCGAGMNDGHTVYYPWRGDDDLREQHWCDYCYEEHSIYCERCEENYYDDHMTRHNDNYYCRACMNEIQEEEECEVE